MVIIIVIIIIYIIYKLSYKKTGSFWSEQPVMRIPTLKWKNMKSLPYFNIKIPNDFILEYGYDNHKIVSFIQKYFSNELVMSYDNMLSHISNTKSTNICLLHNEELCATIHSRPIKIKLDDNIYEINYVEYLCVKPELRGNNIASIMISSLINRMNSVDFDIGRVYLFKKDGKIHDFIPFASSKYLCYKIEDFYNDDIMIDASGDYYKNWKNYCDKHRFCLNINEDVWTNFIKNKKVYHIGSDIIVGQLSQIKNGDSVYDIEYIFPFIETSSVRWNNLYSILRKQDIKYVTINDISDFKEKIPNISKWKHGNEFQYYLYNAECPLIKKEELFFTIN
jgi:hypothetical protein